MIAIDTTYRAQVDLLLQILPYTAEEESLALKGGTAINMFVWDMPRLSVDIDLAYIPLDDRETAIASISDSIMRLKDKITKDIPDIKVMTVGSGQDQEEKLLCNLQGVQVKIEINTVMRGTLRPPHFMSVSNAVEKEFEKFVGIKVISAGELFGGKICAALDRQHPRDLFDVYHLLESDGFTHEVKEGFIAALLSHKRPIHEILDPNFLDQREAFIKQFQGMALKPFTYADFEKTRILLIETIHNKLTDRDRSLLRSFKAGEPDWSLSDIATLQHLPAVKWKLSNIRKLLKDNPTKHANLLEKLRVAL